MSVVVLEPSQELDPEPALLVVVPVKSVVPLERLLVALLKYPLVLPVTVQDR